MSLLSINDMREQQYEVSNRTSTKVKRKAAGRILASGLLMKFGPGISVNQSTVIKPLHPQGGDP
jgi:hypothetical protein